MTKRTSTAQTCAATVKRRFFREMHGDRCTAPVYKAGLCRKHYAKMFPKNYAEQQAKGKQ